MDESDAVKKLLDWAEIQATPLSEHRDSSIADAESYPTQRLEDWAAGLPQEPYPPAPYLLVMHAPPPEDFPTINSEYLDALLDWAARAEATHTEATRTEVVRKPEPELSETKLGRRLLEWLEEQEADTTHGA